MLATLIAASYHFLHVDISLPFLPLSVLGTALAITMGFRNNAAYARWWEARTHWGTISTVGRQYVRLIITFTESHPRETEQEQAQARAFIDTAIARLIAWMNVLRCQLRGEPLDSAALSRLSTADRERLTNADAPATMLLLWSGAEIYTAMNAKILQGFDSFQLEGCLAQLQAAQGGCERIKQTPLPRQYAFFTTVFLWTFIVLTPLCLASLWASAPHRWLVVPLTVLITFIFVIVDKTGRVTEDPFEGAPQDVAMTSITRAIEREVLEMAGVSERPPKLVPHDGALM
jgi:putative membrane protein